ncbi:hypothetical protein GCM10010191_11600 [Actinomadura vinacea]|uniref:Coenzyme Q-binding protein COQ10 START domain-containing protein n=1 Tax=Actinomadura vinacea TaxID=115336 RepID=A0ABN3II65_9ACTN
MTMTERKGPAKGTELTEGLPTERLAQEAQNFLNALAERALLSISDKLSESTDQLVDHLEQGGPGIKSAVSGLTALVAGKSPFRAAASAGATGLKEKVKKMFGGGKGGKSALKLTNIVEQMDVGVPIRLAYNQWTQFKDFPSFMKKIEGAEQESEEKVNWKAQILWSHRNWESTIVEQVPDDHIVWRSKGPKGYVDGVVSFSELAPNLTRIMLVMEYHPQGFFEHTGNLWRAQGRRTRLEMKHFRRHVMAHVILEPDEIEGWRGEIRDSQVVKTHEETLDEERRREEGEPEGRAEAPEAPEGEEVAEERDEERAEPTEEEPAEEERELVGEADEGEPPEEREEEAREAPAEEPEDSGGAVRTRTRRTTKASRGEEEEEEEERGEEEARPRRPRAPAQRRAEPTARRGQDRDVEEDEVQDERDRERATSRRRSGAR